MGQPPQTTVERGYGREHNQQRRKYQRQLDAGQQFVCARVALDDCTHPDDLITAGTRWDLGHTEDRSAWTGPEHVDCNRRAGGRNGQRAAAANAIRVDRDWA